MKDEKFGTPLKVLELKRISIGNFKLDIESGKWRFLSVKEESKLIHNLGKQKLFHSHNLRQ